MSRLRLTIRGDGRQQREDLPLKVELTVGVLSNQPRRLGARFADERYAGPTVLANDGFDPRR